MRERSQPRGAHKLGLQLWHEVNCLCQIDEGDWNTLLSRKAPVIFMKQTHSPSASKSTSMSLGDLLLAQLGLPLAKPSPDRLWVKWCSEQEWIYERKELRVSTLLSLQSSSHTAENLVFCHHTTTSRASFSISNERLWVQSNTVISTQNNDTFKCEIERYGGGENCPVLDQTFFKSTILESLGCAVHHLGVQSLSGWAESSICNGDWHSR